MKNHKQNWYHFSEEPKFGNKNGTILGKFLPIFVEKLNPSFGKNSKSHTRNFVNLAPSNPLKARGGGKRHFFSFYICDRAAEDEQVEKNRIKIR